MAKEIWEVYYRQQGDQEGRVFCERIGYPKGMSIDDVWQDSYSEISGNATIVGVQMMVVH
ncbi:hypothetical protein [Tindallia californiensis]|uniref:Uncharacterized protein n=1 Tax=Tindallia californiensis TaxID=159292 RepID=A0A1H3QZI3_9FIRM|nr:hypothetical protein [Tindallia californiensis]SDZ18837.1 hypothetical protein SAMN05192546_11149 [Tindallia californiensis]